MQLWAIQFLFIALSELSQLKLWCLTVNLMRGTFLILLVLAFVPVAYAQKGHYAFPCLGKLQSVAKILTVGNMIVEVRSH